MEKQLVCENSIVLLLPDESSSWLSEATCLAFRLPPTEDEDDEDDGGEPDEDEVDPDEGNPFPLPPFITLPAAVALSVA